MRVFLWFIPQMPVTGGHVHYRDLSTKQNQFTQPVEKKNSMSHLKSFKIKVIPSKKDSVQTLCLLKTTGK